MIKHKLPAGRYFIGDVCFALSPDIINEWGKQHSCKNGIFWENDGFFIAYSTSFERGTYTGSDNANYMIDSGNIGVVSDSLIYGSRNNLMLLGTVKTFLTDVSFQYVNCTIKVGNTLIST